MGVFSDIETALQKKLDSIPSHPKIQWENDTTYKPSNGVRYWRPTHLPIRGEIASMNALQKHQGIFQVDVFVPAEKGLAQLMDDLDAIYTTYNTVLSLYQNETRVDMLNIGRGKIVRDQAWCMGFIEIYYVCYSH